MLAPSRLGSGVIRNRNISRRFGHYNSFPRSSAFRAVYSFTGQRNNDVFLNIDSSKRVHKIGHQVIHSVRHGVTGIAYGPGMFSPTPTFRSRHVSANRRLILEV